MRKAWRLPAWHSNRLKRLVKSAKRVLVEPAMVAPLLGVDHAAALSVGDLMGRVIETFVVAQLRPELGVASGEVRLHHLRTDDGRREVDLIAEYPDGRVVGLEVKASSAPSPHDGRHLEGLAREIGDRYITGIVLHTGRTLTC